MIRRNDINDALKARLASGMPLKGVWPNVATDDKQMRPFYHVEFVAVSRKGPSLAGTLVRETGTMFVTVVVEADNKGLAGRGGEQIAHTFTDFISDIFPQALVIPITGGKVTIMQPADIRNGFRDGSDWRVPVAVRYSAVGAA